ncbi:purine-nucleoside phosphorylase [Pullulanibacillus pueri]|uniref:Purine nucleoside phosphorylase n=1 Tax=Pullulanibacillus pueri TaxID=1437324 RepID=A0A8J2ZV22_9BACL|nr:purine-nucleoside phosphorylase [Pullulanibacillus pueri]MBM7681667.1 purine-nucleoside phosphorylase [Pullulanibacillus pueri]GGH79246.1 purine nucleoside phosphorylase [Pullulanibacillus pueri]
MSLKAKITEAAEALKNKLQDQPKLALILGSGLGPLADELEEATKITYTDLPYFPQPTVEGHAGQFVSGRLHGIPVLAMQGRYHYYEGYSLEQVTFPVRVLKAIGIKTLIVTNAAGGVNESYKPGELMLIQDHINWMGQNPLIGPNDATLGARFPDMSEVYDAKLRKIARETAASLDIKLNEGVYCAVTGPSYETPAEVRMIRTLGGDAVGMSTVPEAIIARHGGMKVLGISCITNAASGILDQPLSHDEVIETSERVKETFIQLVKAIVKAIR